MRLTLDLKGCARVTALDASPPPNDVRQLGEHQYQRAAIQSRDCALTKHLASAILGRHRLGIATTPASARVHSSDSTMQSELEDHLMRAAELLSEHGQEPWARELASLAHESRHDPEEAARKTRGLFGGAASLSDVVLYRDGQVALDANEALDDLRHKLFAVCQSIRA